MGPEVASAGGNIPGGSAGPVSWRGVRHEWRLCAVDMHIPWRKAVRDAVKNRQWPLWNRFQLAGEPLLAVQMSEVLWPGTWLGFALPLAQAWTFDMALRVFLALLAAFLLLRDMDCSDVAACFGATAWALCDFLIFFVGYPPGPAAASFPLLVLGLRRVALTNGNDGRGITVAAMALILSAGHPETSLHAAAFGGVFFLIVLFQQPANRRARPLRQALVSGFLGVALMAVTLVPFLEVLPHTFEYGLLCLDAKVRAAGPERRQSGKPGRAL